MRINNKHYRDVSKNNIKIRYSWIDFLRIFACMLVIFNHTNGYGLFLTTSHRGGIRFIYLVIAMCVRCNVPLFFMISGALLLNRENEDIYSTWRHRIVPTFIILVVVSAIYYITTVDLKKYSFMTFCRLLFEGKVSTPYWFLYSYIAYLVMSPYLKMIVCRMRSQDFKYFCAIHMIIWVSEPIINLFFQICGYEALIFKLEVPIMSENMIFYPIIGGYLLNNETCLKNIARWSFFAIIGNLIAIWCTIFSGNKFGYSENFVQMFDWATAIVVFITSKYLFERYFLKMERYKKLLSFLASLTFGIYLIDPILRKPFWNIVNSITEPHMITLLASLVWVFFSMCVGGLITYWLKHIPILRYFL